MKKIIKSSFSSSYDHTLLILFFIGLVMFFLGLFRMRVWEPQDVVLLSGCGILLILTSVAGIIGNQISNSIIAGFLIGLIGLIIYYVFERSITNIIAIFFTISISLLFFNITSVIISKRDIVRHDKKPDISTGDHKNIPHEPYLEAITDLLSQTEQIVKEQMSVTKQMVKGLISEKNSDISKIKKEKLPVFEEIIKIADSLESMIKLEDPSIIRVNLARIKEFLQKNKVLPILVKTGDIFDPINHVYINPGQAGQHTEKIVKIINQGYYLQDGEQTIVIRKPEVEVNWVNDKVSNDDNDEKTDPKSE